MGSRTLVDDPVVGRMSKIIMEALTVRDQMKAAGASDEELAAGFEQVIRDAWVKPEGRTTPWRYLCDDCQDTGLRMLLCRPGDRCDGISTRTDGPKEKPGKYLRLCARGESDYEHDYGVPCWCARGVRFKERRRSEQDFTAATKSQPKAPTRFSR